MGQPTQTEIALKEWKEAGVPVAQVPRIFVSKRMSGFNAEVYANWIERWALNAATNFPVIKGAEGVSFLKNAAKDVPAVVVGIGPSLDEAIKDLTKAPRHAVVIATDAALRPLIKAGIHPDLVLNYDARDEQPTMWDTIDTSPYVLLANSVTSPFTINAWKGSTMFFNMIQSDDEFASNILPAMFPFLGGLPNMGTVGNGAIFLAHLMGCRPILTVGMDLCYSEAPNRPPELNVPPAVSMPEEVSQRLLRYRCQDWHFVQPTQEKPDGDWKLIENKKLYNNQERVAGTSVEEIKGKKYVTDDALKFYRNSLFSNIGGLDMPVINCSGGVFSDLLPTMSLREALETKCYAALDPGRTIVKFLKTLIPAPNLDWNLRPDARLFLPSDALRARITH